MKKNKVFAIAISFFNFAVISFLIGWVIDNPMIQLILAIYALLFSSLVSFMLRKKPGDE